MPVVPAAVETLVPDLLTVRWAKGAPLSDVEGFLTFLLEADGLGEVMQGAPGPGITVDVGKDVCYFQPETDIWSMILAEELAARLARCQSGEILDGAGIVLAAFDSEESRPWAALESVGIMSLFRPRPAEAPDAHSHPLIPLDDCKVSGVRFNEERECILDVYFDYWARPCAFLVEEADESILLYRPMYRHRQAIFGPSDLCTVTMRAPPESRIYGALGVRGYKIDAHRVDDKSTWTIKGQRKAFSLKTCTEEAWLTRTLPVWCRADPVLLSAPTDREFTVDDLLHRKEQHWDIIDAFWGQEWYVAAHEDGTLNPFGRIYRADPTAALLDLPGIKPKTE
jgi:hypothetical protein